MCPAGKEKKENNELPGLNPVNPADEGLPHPFVHGDDRDRLESPIRKQEAEQNRGEDNEESEGDSEYDSGSAE